MKEKKARITRKINRKSEKIEKDANNDSPSRGIQIPNVREGMRVNGRFDTDRALYKRAALTGINLEERDWRMELQACNEVISIIAPLTSQMPERQRLISGATHNRAVVDINGQPVPIFNIPTEVQRTKR